MRNAVLVGSLTLALMGCQSGAQMIQGNQVVTDLGTSNWLRPSTTFSQLWQCGSIEDPYTEEVVDNVDDGYVIKTTYHDAVCKDAKTLSLVAPSEPGFFGKLWGAAVAAGGYVGMGYFIGNGLGDSGSETNVNQSGASNAEGTYSNGNYNGNYNSNRSSSHSRSSNYNSNRNSNMNTMNNGGMMGGGMD